MVFEVTVSPKDDACPSETASITTNIDNVSYQTFTGKALFNGICQKGELSLGDDAPPFVTLANDCTWTEHTGMITNGVAASCDSFTKLYDLETAKKICELSGDCCTHITCTAPEAKPAVNYVGSGHCTSSNPCETCKGGCDADDGCQDGLLCNMNIGG